MYNRSRLIVAIRRWISDRQVYTLEQCRADLEVLRQGIEDVSVVEGTIIISDHEDGPYYQKVPLIDNKGRQSSVTTDQLNQLKAMLERRGYTRETVTSEYQKLAIGRIICAVEREWQTEIVLSRTAAGAIDECLGNWQHHMWCTHCHEPLLLTGVAQPNEDVERLLGASEQDIAAMKERASAWHFRSARRGPSSELLTVCPGCLVPLSERTVREIHDEVFGGQGS